MTASSKIFIKILGTHNNRSQIKSKHTKGAEDRYVLFIRALAVILVSDF